MAMNDPSPEQQPNEGFEPSRRMLIRDAMVFQLKLIVDGLRDLLLVPVSLLVALISLLPSNKVRGQEFYDLLRYGRQTERYINLFGAADRLQQDGAPDDDIDRAVSKLEALVVDEVQHGRMTKRARDRIEQLRQKLNRQK